MSHISAPARQQLIWRFVRGSSIYAGGIALQFVTIVILARMLGPTEFGRYSIYTAISLILIEVLALGSGDVLIKNVALQPQSFSAYFGHSLLISAIGLLPCSIALTVMIYAYELTSAQLLLVVAMCALEIGFGRVTALGEQAFIAHKQASAANALRLWTNLVRMLAALGVLTIGAKIDFTSWAAIQAATTLLTGMAVLLTVAARLGKPQLRLLPDAIIPGLPFSGTQIVRLTQLQVDRLLIGLVASPYVVGIYAAASRVISLGTVPMVTLLRMTYPYFFVRGARGMRHTLPFGLQVLAGLLGVAAVTVLVFYFGASYLPLLLGQEYQGAVASAQLLAPIAFAFAFQYAGGDLLSGTGHQMLRFVSTVLNLIFIAIGILLFGGSGGPLGVVSAVLTGNAVGAAATWTFVLWVFLLAPAPQDTSVNNPQ